MKKLFVTIAIIIFAVSATPAANNLPVDPIIVSKFEKDFSFATNVKWQAKEDLSQVSFLLNGQSVVAWYNADAELVIIARNILYDQMPISVTKALEKNYGGADFYNMIEVTHNGELHYQVTAETKKKTVVLQITPAGTITVKKRIK